ncbi:MAG: orotate phosphoribosyltransferase [Puniceicoccales bacterium]|jgi:orotate phosphoribosyltransferase|nr:orotate phosphoribosyltransferase [Puniceicoccales bacterium]
MPNKQDDEQGNKQSDKQAEKQGGEQRDEQGGEQGGEQGEVLQIFRETGALLSGHFVLRSGLRSGHFFQCAQVCQHLAKVTRLVELLLPKLAAAGVAPGTTVLAPAMGGLVLGQEVARQMGGRFIFAEKENDKLVLRRNFKIAVGEPVLIVEDVVTRGGRVLECLAIVRQHRGVPAAVAALVDRSAGNAKFTDVVDRSVGNAQSADAQSNDAPSADAQSTNTQSTNTPSIAVPFVPLLELSFPTYPPDALPPELASLPAVKPGS